MKRLFEATVLAMVLCTSAAQAQYGASATVSISVGPLQEKDINGSTFHLYEATVTWSGSCADGDNNGFGGNIESTREAADPDGVDQSSGGMSGSGSVTYKRVVPGQVIRGHGFASCSDNGGQESDDQYTEIQVLPPHIVDSPMIMSEQPAEFFNCLPVGTEVLLHHDWTSMGLDDEELEIAFKGAGIEYTKRIPADDTSSLKVYVKATTAGQVEYTRSHYGTWNGTPISTKSNVFVLEAKSHQECSKNPTTDAGTQAPPDAGNGDGDGDGDGDGKGEDAGGCSSVPALSTVALLAVVAGALRRRGTRSSASNR